MTKPIEYRDEAGNLIASTEPQIITHETLMEDERRAFAKMRPADARAWVGDTAYVTAGRPEGEDYTTRRISRVLRDEQTQELEYEFEGGGGTDDKSLCLTHGEWLLRFYGPDWDGTPISERFAPWSDPFMGNEEGYRSALKDVS